jgi:cystathionine beta-synthase
MIITLPEKMSQEKVDVLKALGAEIIRTPTEAAWDSPESHIGVARRLNAEIPGSVILDQYTNPSNPLAHYDGTAEEIWEQCGGRLDMVVLSAGTGGTLTGVARRLKELHPALIVVGVDPKGSILAQPEALNEERRLQPYAIEGVGYDFVPAVLDRALVDVWVKTGDAESFIMARRLIREEGLLCGGSSGAALAGALHAAKRLRAGQRCVVLLPDSIRNYMSKHLSDDWLWRQGVVDVDHAVGVAGGGEGAGARAPAWWASRTVGELGMATPITVTPGVTAAQAVQLLNANSIDQLPVVDEGNNIVGVVTEGNLTSRLMSGRLRPSDEVAKATFTQFRRVAVTTPLAELARAFDKDHFAVVVQTQRVYTGGGAGGAGSGKAAGGGSGVGCVEKQVIVGIVSRIDLLRFITAGSGPDGSGTPVAANGRSPRAGGAPVAATASGV